MLMQMQVNLQHSRSKEEDLKGVSLFLGWGAGMRRVGWQNAIAAYYLTYFIPSLFQTQHQLVDDHLGGNSLVGHQEH